ncbi:putative leucine-rich repeat-containing protein DDB_G0290503 [Drosophila biarmipes]|uniref:putative leucine-rich repeat-containing protein DDB_G0290503 n=1 Tax=Drosophila biarmipes TaxID=125945 RepID=UPI0007E8234B|nr:putative leucine-rich repeat-containing protein DDB_G0290503 [Drosophila biarmipes]
MSIIVKASFSQITLSAGHTLESGSRTRIGSSVVISNEALLSKRNDGSLAARTVTKQGHKKGAAKVVKNSVAPDKEKPPKVSRSSQKKVESQAVSKAIFRAEKSRESSKDGSRRSSQKFNFRDRSSRSFLSDSPVDRESLKTLASDISISSRLSTRKRKSSTNKSKSSITLTGFWGPQRVHLLKTERPKEADEVKTENGGVEQAQVEFAESSDSNSLELNAIPDWDSMKGLTSLLSGSETETESTTEVEYVLEEQEDDKPAERFHFLKVFGSLPDINQLSATNSAEVIEVPNVEARFVSAVDEVSYRSSESDRASDLQVEKEYTENLELKTSISGISLEDQTCSDEEVECEIVPEKPVDEDISEYLLTIRPRLTAFDESTSSSEEVISANKEVVKLFLIGLINETVQFAERTAVRLGRLLDKEKMLKELRGLVIDYQSESQRNQLLEKVTTDYFVRRKEFSFVIEPKQIETINRERLMGALVELDNRLEQMQKTEQLCQKQIQDLTEEMEVSRNLVAEQTAQFESKVRETLCKEGNDHIMQVIDDLFREMNVVRDEMSQMREDLIFIQQRLQTLKNKSEQLENLGDGLRVLEYISDQSSNNVLEQKVKERELELYNLRERKVHAIHAMAHLMNKKKMNAELLHKMKSKLKVQEKLKRDLRDRLHKGMVLHEQLKKRASKLKKTGCLMQYPDLLRDYDATVEHLQTKRVVVRKLRIEHKRLERRISEVDAHIDHLTLSLRKKLSYVSGSLRLSSRKISRTQK